MGRSPLPRRTTEEAPDRPTWWTTDEWETPPTIVEEYALEFGDFTLDACARAASAKAPFYYNLEQDGLAHPWSGRVWVNPPYSNPAAWVKKAAAEHRAGRTEVIVMLLPVAVDTGWFHDYVLPYAEVRFRRGRIKFLGWMGTPIGSPTAGNIIAIYRRSA
jgi:site-specific DNA-methyltransferase (adenine-specific)